MNNEQVSNGREWAHDEPLSYAIMIVEDEQLMRSIIVQLLRREGSR